MGAAPAKGVKVPIEAIVGGVTQADAEAIVQSDTQEICLHCHELIERVPIVYGYPTDELGEEGARGEVVLGGCLVESGQPEWACPKCRGALW